MIIAIMHIIHIIIIIIIIIIATNKNTLGIRANYRCSIAHQLMSFPHHHRRCRRGVYHLCTSSPPSETLC
jgi:hypothetical protein